MPFRADGRLTLSRLIRHGLALPDGADVLVVVDAEYGLLRVCAASKLTQPLLTALDGLELDPNEAERS